MTSWYDRAFGPWYLELYPHRNLAEAGAALETLVPWIPEEGVVLDVGCGPGRHLQMLRERGCRVVGLDRSRALLDQAAGVPGIRGHLVRGDMRMLPFDSAVFSTALSMFTSFGYFGSWDVHRKLLDEIARVVRPRGHLILDYLNAPVVRSQLVPNSSRTVSGYEVLEKRFIRSGAEGEQVVKELIIQDGDGEEVERFEEEVSLYEREEILELLQEGGWREVTSLGDYAGNPWHPESPRLLVVAVRNVDE